MKTSIRNCIISILNNKQLNNNNDIMLFKNAFLEACFDCDIDYFLDCIMNIMMIMNIIKKII